MSEYSESRTRDLVVECLRRLRRDGDAGVDDVCSGDAQLAGMVAERLRFLREIGLIATEEEAGHGEQIAHYALVRELGRGGQGVVWLARDLHLGRLVAIKVLIAGADADARVRRFRREAELASKLDHPHICGIHEAGLHEGAPYIVMPYLEGETLQTHLHSIRDTIGPSVDEHVDLESSADSDAADDARTPATTNHPRGETSSAATPTAGAREIHRFLVLFEKIALALGAAHAVGIVHRDIKPGNIFVKTDGEPVVLDFGLARDDGSDADLTNTGDFLGTPAYMSPEQLTGQRVRTDGRSDIYSLGVTLYECLTRRRPFEAPTREALYQAILTKSPIDPRRLNPAVSSDLALVLSVALAKDRDGRYQTAEDFAEDLARIRAGRSILARAPGPVTRAYSWVRRNRAVAALTAAVILSLAVGLVAALVGQRDLEQALEERDAAETQAQLLALAAQGHQIVARAAALWPISMSKRQDFDLWIADAGKSLALRPRLERELSTLRGRGRPVEVPDVERETAIVQLSRVGAQIEARIESTVDVEERGELELSAARVRERLAEIEARSPTQTRWAFADRRDQTVHEQILACLSWLDATERELVVGETLTVAVRAQLATVFDGGLGADYAAAWRGARGRILNDPRYSFDLAEQERLWPLGPDPMSGLEEFLDLPTHRGAFAEIPRLRGADGSLAVAESTGLVFVLIPGGPTITGSQSQDKAGTHYDPYATVNETPLLRVSLAPYFISKYEMSQAQWARVRGERPSVRAGTYLGRPVPMTHPVENVTWHQAQSLLADLGLLLPTEVQWEHAARAGETGPWPGGGDPADVSETSINLADQALAAIGTSVGTLAGFEDYDDGAAIHAPVFTFAPNAFGLHHVLGNVAEWCRDPVVTYGLTRPAPEGAAPPRWVETGVEENADRRMYRGGAYSNNARWCRFGQRDSLSTSLTDDRFGVRPIRRIDR